MMDYKLCLIPGSGIEDIFTTTTTTHTVVFIVCTYSFKRYILIGFNTRANVTWLIIIYCHFAGFFSIIVAFRGYRVELSLYNFRSFQTHPQYINCIWCLFPNNSADINNRQFHKLPFLWSRFRACLVGQTRSLCPFNTAPYNAFFFFCASALLRLRRMHYMWSTDIHTLYMVSVTSVLA